jgi:hypothetical protein
MDTIMEVVASADSQATERDEQLANREAAPRRISIATHQLCCTLHCHKAMKWMGHVATQLQLAAVCVQLNSIMMPQVSRTSCQRQA